MSETYGYYYESPTNNNIRFIQIRERERERENTIARISHMIRYNFFYNSIIIRIFTSGDPEKPLRFLENFDDDRPLPDFIQAETQHELYATFYESMVGYVIDQ